MTVGREATSGSITPTRSFDMKTYYRCPVLVRCVFDYSFRTVLVEVNSDSQRMWARNSDTARVVQGQSHWSASEREQKRQPRRSPTRSTPSGYACQRCGAGPRCLQCCPTQWRPIPQAACSPSSANLGERIDGYDRIPDAAPSTRA